MVVKIVHDHLVDLLGREASELNLSGPPPRVILMVGLQGSGKTTTSAKLAYRLRTKERALASLDVQRPAAQEQLAVLADQAGVASLPIVPGQTPVAIAQRAVETATRSGDDVVILDTAGRLHIDEALMAELEAIRDRVRPHETLLVADALTGQDAVNLARTFHERVGLSGIVLTRIDGDGRGGAALSMRAVTAAADQAGRRGRRSMRSRRSTPIAWPRASSAWATWCRWSSGWPRRSTAKRPSSSPPRCKGQLQPRRPRHPAAADAQDGRHERHPRHAAAGKIRQQLADHQIDDRMIARQLAIIGSMTPSGATADPARLAQAADRCRLGHGGAGGQAAEAVSADADHDEAGQEDGPQAVHGPRSAPGAVATVGSRIAVAPPFVAAL